MKLIMVNLEEAIYRAAMAPPIQILPATVSEMPLMGIMNLYMLEFQKKTLYAIPIKMQDDPSNWEVVLGRLGAWTSTFIIDASHCILPMHV